MFQAPLDECYTFASFHLYPHRRTLLHCNEIVSIGGRAFDILHLLVSRAGGVVSASDIMNSAWPNITVGEANLRVQMGVLRKVLSQCDEAQRAIETIPLRGYCFILPICHYPHGIVPNQRKRPPQRDLPVLLNSIIGREDAINLIAHALEDHPLVTISGPGGIGKTAVAAATANHVAAHFRDGVSFIDLSCASDGDSASSAIARALGIVIEDDILAGLCAQLRDLRALLILDTCEHIVEPIAAMAEVLLAHCPNLRLLVTSREALRAIGEWTHRLSSLPFPASDEIITNQNMGKYSAVTLFVDRTRALTCFDPGNEDLQDLAEICRRLDGNPLALEFAATRMPDLGLRKIAASLDDRFAIFTRGRRTALPRHRTLSASMDWSLSLLSSDEKRMLNQIAIFEGAFTAEMALAYCRDVDCMKPAETLSNLYDKSLLSIDMGYGDPLYRLLDTTKAYIMSEAATSAPVLLLPRSSGRRKSPKGESFKSGYRRQASLAMGA